MNVPTYSNEARIYEKLDELGCAVTSFCTIAGIGRTRLVEALTGKPGKHLDQTTADTIFALLNEMGELKRASLVPPDWTDAAKLRHALEAGREARKLLNEEGFELEKLGYGEKA